MSKTIVKPAIGVASFIIKISADTVSTVIMGLDSTKKGLKKEFKHLKKTDKRTILKNLSRKNGSKNIKRLRS